MKSNPLHEINHNRCGKFVYLYISVLVLPTPIKNIDSSVYRKKKKKKRLKRN